MVNLLETVLGLSITGTFLFLVIFTITKCFQNQISRKVTYYLWILVLLQLMIPLGYQINVNYENLIPQTSQVTQKNETHRTQEDWKATPAPEEETISMVPTTNESVFGLPSDNLYSNNAREAKDTRNFAGVFALIWIAGIVSTLGYKGMQYAKLCDAMAMEPVTDANILNLYAQINEEIGLKKPAALLHTSDSEAPMMMGLLAPKILLPKDISYENAEYILRHEIVHYKRKDILYKWAVQIVCCIHWFNPIVYFLNNKISKDCELSCDEAVCHAFSEHQRISYGMALLSVIKVQEKSPGEDFCTAMGTEGLKLKERLQFIKESKRYTSKEKAIATVFISFLCVMTLLIGGCTVNIQAQDLRTSEEVAMDQLAESIVFDRPNGDLWFTIPEEIPDGYQVWIHISEKNTTEDGFPSSAHWLDDEESTNWLPGESYATQIDYDNLEDCTIAFGLIKENGGQSDLAYYAEFQETGFRPLAFEANYSDWQSAYYRLMHDFIDTYDMRAGRFYLADLDHDGIPELLIGSKDLYVYAYRSGFLRYLGTVKSDPYLTGKESPYHLASYSEYDSGNRGDGIYSTIASSVLIQRMDKRFFFHDYQIESTYYIDNQRVEEADYHAETGKILKAENKLQATIITEEVVDNLPVVFAQLWEGGNESILKAANVWATAFVSREGILRYDMLAPDKQETFFEDQIVVSDKELFETDRFISLRGSSPFVTGYRLEYVEPNQINITYSMADSSTTSYLLSETLHFREENGSWIVYEYTISDIEPMGNYRYNSIDSAIKGQLKEIYQGGYPEGDYFAAGYATLKTMDKGRTTTHYLFTAYSAYHLQEGAYFLKHTGGSPILPAVIEIRRHPNDTYSIVQFQTPSGQENLQIWAENYWPHDLWGKVLKTEDFLQEIHEKQMDELQMQFRIRQIDFPSVIQ